MENLKITQMSFDQLVTKEDIQLFLNAFSDVVKKTKEDFDLKSGDNLKVIEDTLSIIESKLSSMDKLDSNISDNAKLSKDNLNNTQSIINDLKKWIEDSKSNLVSEIRSQVKDGDTPSEEYLIKLISSLLPEPEEVKETYTDTGEEIINKINDLDDNSPKIDAKHISNLPNFNPSIISNSNKYLGQMLDVDLSSVTLTNGKYVLGSGGGSYTLPIASGSTLGGVKVGSGLSIDGSGVLSASGGGSGITLKTNGTDNGSQTILNLQAGTGIALTDNGTGQVTIENNASVGDVIGPASSVGDNVVLFDGITGILLKDSGLTLSGANTGD